MEWNFTIFIHENQREELCDSCGLPETIWFLRKLVLLVRWRKRKMLASNQILIDVNKTKYCKHLQITFSTNYFPMSYLFSFSAIILFESLKPSYDVFIICVWKISNNFLHFYNFLGRFYQLYVQNGLLKRRSSY